MLASYGTCAFGVKSSAVLPFTVGNDDIIQLMYVSINNWQRYEVIGASGNMDGGLSVWWGIY